MTSRKYLEEEDRNGHYVKFSLLDYNLWSSRLWKHATVIKMNIQVQKSVHTEFTDEYKVLDTGRFPRDARLSLKSIPSQSTAYGLL